MKVYKGVLVGKSSELSAAMDDKDPDKAKKVFEATTERFNKMYSEEDRKWFWTFSKHGHHSIAGLMRLPVTQEITGSNPVGVATQ